MTPGVRQFVRVVVPGDAGRRRLSNQRLHRHFLPDPHRHRRDELFQLCRPAEPAAARRDRRRARHRDPAAGQPPCRRRRSRQGGARSRARRPSWRCCCACPRRWRWRSAPGRWCRRCSRAGGSAQPMRRSPRMTLAIIVARPPRLCAGQGADARLLRAAGHGDAGQDRGRRPGRQHRAQFRPDPAVRDRRAGRGDRDLLVAQLRRSST